MNVSVGRLKKAIRSAVARPFHASSIYRWRHRGKVAVLMYHRVLTKDEFNDVVNEINKLAKDRAALSPRISEAEEQFGPHSRAALDLKHDAVVMEMRVEELKDQVHKFRTALREILFTGVKGADEKLFFYPRNAVPPDLKSDGRVWLMRVGNRALDVTGVTLIGGGDVVGLVPKGLPALTIPKLDVKVVLHLLPIAAIISLLGFMEAVSIAKAMAAKTGQRLDPNQELIAKASSTAI